MPTVDEILALAAQGVEQPIETSIPQIAPTSSYGLKQLAFDIPTGALKATAGLADVLSYPVVKGLQLAGAPVETFGTTKTLETGAEALATMFGVRPQTEMQKAVEFIAPTPLSKGKIIGDALYGGLGYLGSKVGEVVAPDSPITQLALSLGFPIATQKAAANVLTEGGKSLQRQSFGLRKADLTSAKNAILETPSGDFQTQVTKSLDNLLENNVLGQSRNPQTVYRNLDNAKQSVESEIQSAIKKAEQSVGPVPPPDFQRAQQYLIDGGVPANEIDNYLNEISSYQDALIREGKGSLSFLNRQRKAIGEKWSNQNLSDPGFWRAFYTDIKSHIEQYVPEVQNLNKQKQDLIVAEPIIKQAAKASEKGLSLKDAIRFFGYTTGGGAVPFLAGATGSVPVGALLGAGLGLASTPRGQQVTGKALQTLGESPLTPTALGLAGKVLSQEPKTLPSTETTKPYVLTDEQRQRLLTLRNKLQSSPLQSVESAPAKQEVKVGKQNISIPEGDEFAPPSLVKAVMKVESGGKQEAVSSKGATGLMQIMPATAKDLGIDPKDPQQNVEGGSKYLQQLINKYGSKELALAAYNWGPGNVTNAVAKVEAEGKTPTWEKIKQFIKVPKETREYVDKVLKVAETIASVAPITGEIISAKDTFQSAQAGDYSGAAINALGVIPFLGAANRLRKGVKIVDALSDASKIADANKAIELEKFIAETGLKPELAETILKSKNVVRANDIQRYNNLLQSAKKTEALRQKLVDDARKRVERAFNKGRSKTIIDEQRGFLEEMKNSLAKAKIETNRIQSELKKLLNVT